MTTVFLQNTSDKPMKVTVLDTTTTPPRKVRSTDLVPGDDGDFTIDKDQALFVE